MDEQKNDVLVDPLDYMTFDELEDLQDRIRKAMLRKAIKEVLETKKKKESNNEG